MKRILFGVIGVIFLGLIGVIAVAVLTPKEVYKSRIEAAATGALNREVSLNGDVGLEFFPRISASIEDVTVANSNEFEAPYLIEAGALRASVKWAPLFTGRVEVHEIAFVDAAVALERRADGAVNWDFANGVDTPSETAETTTGSTEVNAGVDRARLVNASLSYSDAVTGDAYELQKFNVEASVKSLTQPLKASGDGIFQGDDFNFELELDAPQTLLDGAPAATDLRFEMDLAKLTYNGTATLSETPAVAGEFSFSAPDIAALADYAKIDPATLPVTLGPLGQLTTQGRVQGPLDVLQLSFNKLDVEGDTLKIAYNGAATLSTTQTVAGNITVSLTDAAATIDALGLDIAEAAALRGGNLTLTSRLDGPAESISASNIDFKLQAPLVNASYKGDVSLANNGSLQGTLSANSDDLRGLLAAAAIEMEPGDTLQNFSVSGNTSGSFTNISLSNLSIVVDSYTGSGDVAIRMDEPVPTVTGNLTTGPLDLGPFLGEAPEEQPEGWSKAPLALDSLKSINADIRLATPALTANNITLRDAEMRAQLINGVLSADITQLTAFGGQWRGNFGVNAGSSTPTVAMVLTGDSILMEEIVQTFVGTDMMTGGGQFKLDVTAKGDSLYDIMNTMNGDLSANLADGAIRGINIGQLVRSASDLRSTLSSGGLPSLSLSPSDETDFSRFDSVLKIRNGVAQINVMELFSSTLGANGSGTINLGAQSLDMALQISADTNARGQLANVQLNNVGIPLKLTGPWTAPGIRPDASALTSLLAGQALDRVGNAIGGSAGDALGGQLGDVLTGALGGQRGNTAQPPAQDAAETEKKEPETVEEAVEDLAKEALGDLFGRKKKD